MITTMPKAKRGFLQQVSDFFRTTEHKPRHAKSGGRHRATAEPTRYEGQHTQRAVAARKAARPARGVARPYAQRVTPADNQPGQPMLVRLRGAAKHPARERFDGPPGWFGKK